jgi:hypothetical protein
MNTASIGVMRVSSKFPVIVYGDVRGLISEHREVGPAREGLRRDRRKCSNLGGGAYSDGAVYVFRRGVWDSIDPYTL